LADALRCVAALRQLVTLSPPPACRLADTCDFHQPDAWPFNTPQPSGLPRLPIEPGYPPHLRAPGSPASGVSSADNANLPPLPSPYTRFGLPLADDAASDLDLFA
jgi:hypothetical protein